MLRSFFVVVAAVVVVVEAQEQPLGPLPEFLVNLRSQRPKLPFPPPPLSKLKKFLENEAEYYPVANEDVECNQVPEEIMKGMALTNICENVRGEVRKRS